MSKSIFGFFFLAGENVGATLANTCQVTNKLNFSNFKKSDHPFV
jgi:hypothetical protein